MQCIKKTKNTKTLDCSRLCLTKDTCAISSFQSSIFMGLKLQEYELDNVENIIRKHSSPEWSRQLRYFVESIDAYNINFQAITCADSLKQGIDHEILSLCNALLCNIAFLSILIDNLFF